MLVGSLVSAAACTEPPTPPAHLCHRDGSEECRRATEIEALLRSPNLRIVDVEETPSGRQNARLLTLEATDAATTVRFRAKWRAMADWHGLNDPRKELAAYAFQKLFLEPADYVVPPTSGHCFSVDAYRTATKTSLPPTYEGSACVFGILTYWLEDAIPAAGESLFSPRKVLSSRRFERDAAYRRSIANANLLTAVTGNGDTHAGQFVMTGDEENGHIYVIDHTISFSDYRNPQLSLDEYFSIIQVPALPADSIERLSSRTMADFDRLVTIEQYRNAAGRLVPTAPDATDTTDAKAEAAVRWTGETLRLGLSRSEIDRVWNRAQDLLERIDRGEIPLFQVGRSGVDSR